MKKIFALFTAFAFLFCFAGCAAKQTEPQITTNLADNALAVVNGTPITQDLFFEFYNGNLAEMGITPDKLQSTYNSEAIASFQNQMLTDLVAQELMLQYAREHNLDTLSEEDLSNIDKRADSYLESIKTKLQQEISQLGSVLVNESAELDKRYAGYLKQYNLSKESVANQLKRQTVLTRVYDDLLKDYKMPENAAKDYYDSTLKEMQELDKSSPEEALQQYLSGQGGVELYVPSGAEEGARYIKHILITSPEEYSDLVTAAESEGDTEKAEELKKQGLEEAKITAEEVIAKLKAGGNFDALIEEYNQDPGMASNPDGYLVYDGAPFVENFLNESLALNNIGDFSQTPVETEYGYHILLFASKPKPGPVAFEEVKTDIETYIDPEQRTAYFEQKLTGMRDSAQIEQSDFSEINMQ